MKSTRNNKILYRTFSFYTIVKYFLLRAMALSFAVACFYNFEYNPIVTGIAGTILLAFFLFTGDCDLIVYKDRFRYSLASIIARKKVEIPFSELTSFQVKGCFGFKMDVISDAAPLYLHDPYNIIEIELIDGTTKQIRTYIYIDKLRKAADLINKQSIELTGSR